MEHLALTIPLCLSLQSRRFIKSLALDVGFERCTYYRQPFAAMNAYRIHENDHEVNVLVVDVDATGVEAAVINVEEETFDVCGTTGRIDIRTVELEASILHAVECLIDQMKIESARIHHILFMGDIDIVEAGALFQDVLAERLPNTRLYNTINPSEVCAHGMLLRVPKLLEPESSAEVICCLSRTLFDVVIETAGGWSELLMARGYLLPCSKTARIRVFSDQQDGTAELRLAEGEHANFRESMVFGVLSIGGLSAGWNDLEVRLDMTYEYILQIDVTPTHEGNLVVHSQLIAPSACIRMASTEVTAYFEQMERITHSAEETERRQRREGRRCSEALVGAVCALLGRDAPDEHAVVSHGEVRVVKFQLSSTSAVEETHGAADWLDQLGDIGPFDSTSERVLHDAALTRLRDRIQWRCAPSSDRCPHCVAWLDTT